MALRLGEYLVYSGAITEDQLERALSAQRVHGGHLGTCLIELGYVDHNRLGETLAQAHGVDYAQRELFQGIGSDIIGAVPRSLVEKHRAVPFGLQNALLHVAMIDPKNFRSIDEVSNATGREVRAFVSPEISILKAMERYYAIPRQPRFALADALEQAIADADNLQSDGDCRVDCDSMQVHWVKRLRNKGQPDAQKSVWCNLLELPLDHEHFNDLEGVYVVWHGGRNPVLHVGEGDIRTQLARIQQESGVEASQSENKLYVTWAPMAHEQLGGVASYLTAMLSPAIGAPLSAHAIKVNLPQ